MLRKEHSRFATVAWQVDRVKTIRASAVAAMSEIFDGYERQYCELSTNLNKKCNSVSSNEGFACLHHCKSLRSVVNRFPQSILKSITQLFIMVTNLIALPILSVVRCPYACFEAENIF